MIVDPSQNLSDDKVEELLESQDLSIFTQDVSILEYTLLKCTSLPTN